MVSSHDFKKAVGLINKSSNILITTHIKPDGDACGSVAAMQDALITLDKKVKLILPSPLPKWYASLFAEKVPVLGHDIQLEELLHGQFGQFD